MGLIRRVRRIFLKGGVFESKFLDAAPGLKKSLSGGGGGDTFFFF